MLIWFRKIDDATSIADLLSVTRAYAETLALEELSRLPKQCRPANLATAADLERLHGCLVEEYRRSKLSGDDLAPLQRMTSLVVRASVRLAELQGEASHPGDDPPPRAPRRHGAPREDN